MYKKFFLTVSAGLFFLSMFGCSSTNPTSSTNSNPLVGTWNMTKRFTSHSNGRIDTVNAASTYSNQYIFNGDNTFNNTFVAYGSTTSLPGTWSATSDSVTLTLLMQPTKYKYTVSGSELTLISSVSVATDNATCTEKYKKQ
jgi:hypothetical protein